MLSTHQYPIKKMSRMKNPFQSSQALESNQSDSKISGSNNGSPKGYRNTKLSNVFQFNERSKVDFSMSSLASEINNHSNQSGENIYPFYDFNMRQRQRQRVEDVVCQDDYQKADTQKESIKSPTFPQFIKRQQEKERQQEKNRQREKTKMDQYTSPQSKQQINQNMSEKSTSAQKFDRNQPTSNNQNTITINYQAPQVKMFKFSDIPEQTNLKNSSKQNIYSSPQGIPIKQQKKTFKPSLIRQLQQDQDNSGSQAQVQQKIRIKEDSLKDQVFQNKQLPISTPPFSRPFSFQAQRKSHIPIPSAPMISKQEVEDENINITISPSQHQSILKKDKQKAKILQEEKLNLSAGSQVHSYTENILDDLRDQLGTPSQQIEVPFQDRNSGAFKKEVKGSNNIVESKIVQQEQGRSKNFNFGLVSQSLNPAVQSRKPRRKIFQPRTEKTTFNHSTNYTRTHPTHHSPYVSQFQRPLQDDGSVSPSQILMKSLNIIDKITTEKQFHNAGQSHFHNQRKESQVVVVPPAPLTITQSQQPNSFHVYSMSPEEISLRKEILELNFELTSIETTFDLERFDSSQNQVKIKRLNEESAKLFQKYKSMLICNDMPNFDTSSHTALKKQLMLLHESTTKLLNFQKKLSQTKQILTSFQQEIKDILLLDSKEKYKKIKLLNEAIEVMDKTETYLSLEIGKIPVLIRGFVRREKVLLDQLRDWIKECISKQNRGG